MLRVPLWHRCPRAPGGRTGTSCGQPSSRNRRLGSRQGVRGAERGSWTCWSLVCCQPSSPRRRVWGWVFFRGCSYFCLASAISVPLTFHLVGAGGGGLGFGDFRQCWQPVRQSGGALGSLCSPPCPGDSPSHRGGAEVMDGWMDGHVPVPLMGFSVSLQRPHKGLSFNLCPGAKGEIPFCGDGAVLPCKAELFLQRLLTRAGRSWILLCAGRGAAQPGLGVGAVTCGLYLLLPRSP